MDEFLGTENGKNKYQNKKTGKIYYTQVLSGGKFELIRLSDIELEYFHEGQECEYYPKIKRLNQHWQKFVGKGKRCVIVLMMGREEVIIELKDTKEMIVCKSTDLFSLDQTR